MAFFGSVTDKQGVERRTADGKKSVAFPTLSPSLTETAVTLPGCSGCSKLSSHCPSSNISVDIPVGETRQERVPATNWFTAAEGMKLQGALWFLHAITHGTVGREILFNFGTAGNNGSHAVRYKITSASGTTLNLQGPNPKRIAVANSRINPDWPLTDEGRLISETFYQSLPVGALVEFDWPSVYHQNNRPVVMEINPPASDDADDVTFSIEVSNDVSNADHHHDEFFDTASQEYYCTIRWEALVNGAWLNFQAPFETQFAQQSATFNTSASHRLKDGDNGDTRVLMESFHNNAFTATLTLQAGGTETQTSQWVNDRITQNQTGANSFTTDLDLTDLDFASTYSQIEVTYYAEAVSGDTDRFFFQASCSNAQQDFGGAYVEKDGRHCVAPDSSGFDDFEAQCWQPTACDGFSIRRLDNSIVGTEAFPVDDPNDARFWSGLFVRANWTVSQFLASINAFFLEMPSGGGASHQGLLGGFRDEVPVGLFTTRYPLFSAQWGQLLQWTDGDGDEHLHLKHGAFIERAYDFSASSGPDNLYNAASALSSSNPAQGAFPAEVSGFGQSDDPDGNSFDERVENFARGGHGSCGVYSYAHNAGVIDRTNNREDGEKFIVDAALSGSTDTDIDAAISARWDA